MNNGIACAMKRDARLQWIRAIAAVLVVCLHSASELMYTLGYGSTEWWVVNVIDALSRCSVPFFVMVSGAIFLDRQEDFTLFYKKRAMRIVIPLVFWTVLYIAISYAYYHYPITSLSHLKTFLKALYNGKPYFHLWYLYMLLGLYLVVPFIQRLWATLTEKQRLLFAVICMGLQAIATFEASFVPVDSGSPNFLLFRFLPYVGYFVFGHYLKTLAQSKRGPNTFVMVFLVTLLSAITIAGSYFYGSAKVPGKYFFDYLSVNVICLSILLFYMMMKKINAEANPPKIVAFVDRHSMGIYLVHPLFLLVATQIYKALMPQGFAFGLFMGVKCVSIVALSALLGWGLSKIPLLRKTV